MSLKYANGIVGLGLLCLNALGAYAQAPAAVSDDGRSDFERPSVIPFPADNPYSPERAELGRKLFFDPILSASRTTSCSTCHQPGRSWSNGLPLAVGDNRQPMNRRAPTLLNVAWLSRLGWDGLFETIEGISFAAITGAANMGVSVENAIERLGAAPGYREDFAKIFGSDGITGSTIGTALATYERTIVSGIAPFDRWIAGDRHAISDAAGRGFDVFNGSGKCSGCHSGWAFTDGSFNDIGVGQGDDVGRNRLFPGTTKLQYAFKTPTLRNVAERAPYMHNGSLKTLAEVVDLYDRGGIDRPSRAIPIKPLGLSTQQKSDLIAFLQTLTSDDSKLIPPAMPD